MRRGSVKTQLMFIEARVMERRQADVPGCKKRRLPNVIFCDPVIATQMNRTIRHAQLHPHTIKDYPGAARAHDQRVDWLSRLTNIKLLFVKSFPHCFVCGLVP